MLNSMSKNLKSLSWVLWVVVIAMGLFAFTSFGDAMKSQNSRTWVALVDGEPVSVEEFQQRYRALARAYRQAGAEAVDGFRKVLLGLITEGDRRALMARRDQAAETDQPVAARARAGRAGL